VTEADALRAAGTSPAAIRHHYDLSDDFFALWLGPELVYSCALWDPADPRDVLAAAQRRKLDYFADRLHVRGGRVLDVGCGWGALLDRFVARHGATDGVGLTLSPSQVAYAVARGVPGTEFRLESWVDHEPSAPYDAVTAIESTEHFATDELDVDEKVDVYRAFFARAAGWLRDGGRIGLQLICLDNVGHRGSRAGRGPLSELIRVDIFPESMPASLAELAIGWETHFELEEFIDHTDHYRRTFRAWMTAFRAGQTTAEALVGQDGARTFARYFAAGEAMFRLREHSLHRVILRRRPQPKEWAGVLRPSALHASLPATPQQGTDRGASGDAVRYHYDVSNDFYALWLGPSMMYSSAMWSDDHDEPLESAHERKLDFFAGKVLRSPGASVLDVGSGWGGNLRRLVERHAVAHGIGLTLSEAQRDFVAARPISGVDVRLESWTAHAPAAPYDAVVSYGAFEHFARDGSAADERVEAYAAFFAGCFEWLRPDGRVALETIAHDSAPETETPLGRGPLGDFVLRLFPESICPQLCEILLGLEPWFEVELLRSDAADFARTFRTWSARLRANEAAATDMVGEETFRRFRRYLAATEMQFRTHALTNYRLVLHRRPSVRR
jgi:cyclopropane-fatty-acyl-phospholipid synthase